MTNIELKSLLKSTGFPVAYSHFPRGFPEFPCICYTITTDERGSDEKNLIEELDVRVELYTDKKDFEAERQVRKVLNFVEFDGDEVCLKDENLFMSIYEFSITQKIKE